MSARRFLTAVLVSIATVAVADALPDGWQASPEGGYAHVASGITCTKQMGTFALANLEGPQAPSIVGTCVYSGGEVRIGKLRVRNYVEGVGETPLAIQNDEALMHPERQPESQKPVMTYRTGPGPEVGGIRTQQMVLTFVSRGFLVDCIVQTRPDDFDYVQKGFLDVCPGT